MTEGYTSQPLRARELSADHLMMLNVESDIDAGVIAERGYWTAHSRADVPDVFAEGQKRAGALIIPMFSPDGTTTGYQIRPGKPFRNPKTGKPVRYMSPAGSDPIVDVHPSMMEAIGDPSRPLVITEGVKKADAATSRGIPTLALAGVWMAHRKGGKDMLSCFDHVALRRRDVFVIFDSDVMVNDQVQMALERIIGGLEDRGARVLVVYLPDGPSGAKVGLDDYFAAGGTVEDLWSMARPFEPGDFAGVRLSRDERLRGLIAGLWAGWRSHPWRNIGGYTDRDVMAFLTTTAARRGKGVAGGVRVAASQREIAEGAGTRQASVSKSLRRLEEAGLIRRDDGDRAKDRAAAYVLVVRGDVTRAYHQGNSPDGEDFVSLPSGVSPLLTDAPLSRNEYDELGRLRWSYVCRTRTKDGYEYELVERLGRIAGAALETLMDAFGGVAAVKDLIAAMNRDDRPGRFRDRYLKKLHAAGIVTLDGDTVTLADDWRAKLMIRRDQGGEYKAEDLTRDRHAVQRQRHRIELMAADGVPVEDIAARVGLPVEQVIEALKPADPAPSEEDMDRDNEDRRRRQEAKRDLPSEPRSPLAEAIDAYLNRNPRDADQGAGWLGVTVWCEGLHPKLANPADEAKAAIHELGGDAYRKALLEGAGGVVWNRD